MIDPIVAGIAGMWSETKLHCSYICSSDSAGVTPSATIFSAGTNGSNAMTSMPRALAFSATRRPTLPYAWIPTFLPFTSIPVPGVNWLRDMKIIIAIASSATAFEFWPGVFIATTPFSVHAGRSRLSKPAPARTTILSFGAAATTSAVTLSERTIIASTSATASRSCALSVYFSRRTSSWPAPSAIWRMPFTAAAANGFSVATKIFIGY